MTTDRIKIAQWSWHKTHPMVTFVMGMMFLAIHYLWIMWEKGLIFQYTSGLRDRALPTLSQKPDQRNVQDVRTDTINYLARLLVDKQNLDWYCLNYFIILTLTGLVLVAQLFYLHFLFAVKPFDFAGYNELIHNLQVNQFDRVSNENDKAILRFPLNFHCYRETSGSAGGKSNRMIICDNEVNGWVEAFYIVNIYTLISLSMCKC